ncbi:Agenet-like domain-containing protein [Artemisia annua]|uniref:Agenet-like domain-containing protein n=1 Tax=Artemisia annua TaxID=35608 RepID=A0A2U1P0T1_ARTAN|nr:Agenet-like domain-containing protein [Artemisia annua]
MATSSKRQKKKKRLSHAPKLLPNELVEVRSVEEGFRGSWHRGTVIECKTQIRVVKYDNLLCGNSSEKLVEFIPVIFAVDGIIPANWQPSNFPNYRGKIRPLPPRVFHSKTCIHYGQCVDVFHVDAWWEGVIFDHGDVSDEWLVFFPDTCDEMRVPFENLRISQDWDAASNEWKLRGNWIFLETVEELKAEFPVAVSLKQIWYEVRMTRCFGKEMKEWTCPIKDSWKEAVKEVVSNNFKLTMADFFYRNKFSDDLDINNHLLNSMINLDSSPEAILGIKSDNQNLPKSKLNETVDNCAVEHSSEAVSFVSSDVSRNFETKKLDVVESEYCPQAVVDYYSLTSESNFELETSKDANFKGLQNSARKHLTAVGWSDSYLENLSSEKVLVYNSPDGKKFYSLGEACNYYISELSCFEFEKEVVKKDESLRPDHVNTSSKRAREEFPPTYRTPRTVLSWLIDNNIVLPRAKVQYYCKKDGSTLKEGRVTRDGIKCNCCNRTFSLFKFQKHAGSTCGRPSANIFLEDGRSLLDCQLQLKLDQNARSKRNQHEVENDSDYICSVCQYGGELMICDQCPSTFHTSCVGLKDIPDGEWFCASCCCGICNANRFSENYDQTLDCNNILNCEQCERRYHVGCVKRREDFAKLDFYLEETWFCSLRCKEIYTGLHRLLGKSIPIGRDNLTWTLRRNETFEYSNCGADSDMEEVIENYSKLNVAISVMHECFEAVKEQRTGRDIVEDVISGRWSELRRLNFKGFYTVLLEKGDELISTAVVRVYGEKVAEVPLVGTRFQYRRRGMCHILMHELEKALRELGVERLVLPAVSSVLHTWTRSFGFSVMTDSEKLRFLGSTFLDFQGTTMCSKLLTFASTDLSISKGIVFVLNTPSLCCY